MLEEIQVSLDLTKYSEIQQTRGEAGESGGWDGGVTFTRGQTRQGGVGVNMGHSVLVRGNPVLILLLALSPCTRSRSRSGS